MKHFLISGLALCFLSSCGAPEETAAGATPAKNYSWSMVTTWPKNYPGLGMAPERFSQLVEEMSQGQLKVTGLWSGRIGSCHGRI
jgi:TRAP-type mannitol/chloroaromatic compound transport system substrate-binding protein